MRSWSSRRWLGAVAWLAALVFASAVSAASRGSIAGADPSRQVLLMLPLPPEHLRPDADYAGGGWGDNMGRSARHRAASQLAHANGLVLVDDWPMPDVGVDCFVLIVPGDRSPAEVAARLSHAPGVAWSQVVSLYQTLGATPLTHNNPYYLAQPAAREWALAALHKVATGRNVHVAVIDSRVDAAHPSLAGQVDLSENFIADGVTAPELHGTAVAGIIAAKADNGIGIAGVAPGARLMALRACRQTPSPDRPFEATCDSLSIAKALEFAIDHKARIINMSLGGPPDALLGKLVDVAESRQIAIVAAYDRELPKGGFPASHPGVVAVADEDWTAAPAGVYGAPGDDIPTTVPGGRYSLVSGSSFSAAHVSGLLALVREKPSNPVRLSVYPGGEVINACATLLGAASACGAEQVRPGEVSATDRR